MNIYFTRFHYVPVTLVATRTFSIPSFLSYYKLTSQLVLARSAAALFFCGRDSGGGLAPLFVLAFFLASSARTHHTLARARLLTHV
jgi:hypothetical protein